MSVGSVGAAPLPPTANATPQGTPPAPAPPPASAMYPTGFDAGSAMGGGAEDTIGKLIGAATSGMNQVEQMLASLQSAAGDKGVDPAQMSMLNRRMQNYATVVEMAKKLEEQKQQVISRLLA